MTIGGVAATGVNVTSSTTIAATTGAHAAGLVDVTVKNRQPRVHAGRCVLVHERRRDAHADSDRHPHRDPHVHPDADAEPDTDGDPDGVGHADDNSDTDGDINSHVHADSDTHRDTDGDADADPDGHRP